jgi:hypothetical protein
MGGLWHYFTHMIYTNPIRIIIFVDEIPLNHNFSWLVIPGLPIGPTKIRPGLPVSVRHQELVQVHRILLESTAGRRGNGAFWQGRLAPACSYFFLFVFVAIEGLCIYIYIGPCPPH